MGWILLFLLSFVLLGLMIFIFWTVGKESDSQYGNTSFTKNQVRLFFWVLGIMLCVVAALVEYLIVIR